MNAYDREDARGSLIGPDFEAVQGDDATVPWVLNQVLLPLILVLTFVALIKVADYRRAWTDLVGSIQQTEPALERQVVTMNLQLVKLLAALQEVENEVTTDFRLNLFESNADRVQRHGATLRDAEFQILCSKASHVLDSDGYSDAATTVYIRCLEIAGIHDSDPGSKVIRTKPTVPIELTRATLVDLDNHDFAEVVQADASQISGRNRRILHNAILDFLDGLGSRVKAVQQELIALMAQDVTDDPALFQLSAEADALLRQMALEDDADSIRRLENEFYAAVVDTWRDRLLADGYAFVVWNELKAL